ncbi:hypothetical protein RQN30_08325 [Arcanobacterium hippocoleae]
MRCEQRGVNSARERERAGNVSADSAGADENEFAEPAGNLNLQD